jgi:hypothetical protein
VSPSQSKKKTRILISAYGETKYFALIGKNFLACLGTRRELLMAFKWPLIKTISAFVFSVTHRREA